jgi:hypothetical protein
VVSIQTDVELRCDLTLCFFSYETSGRIAIMRLHGIALGNDVLSPGLRNAGRFPANVIPARLYDPLMERLVRALLPEAEADKVLHGFYADAPHAAFNGSTGASVADRP